MDVSDPHHQDRALRVRLRPAWRSRSDLSTHGIAAYGDSVKTSMSGLTISGDEVDHLSLGAGEAVVVNGDVDGWAVTGDDVHDDDDIGTDHVLVANDETGAAR